MRVTVTRSDSDAVAEVEVAASWTIGEVRGVVSSSFSLDPQRLRLSFKGEVLPDTATLEDAGVRDRDLLEAIVQRDAGQRRSLSQRVSRSLARRSDASSSSGGARASMRVSEQEMLEQALLAEQIRMRNVQENMHRALEDAPESFATVLMLYVDTVVNNVPVKCFVDSGAQTTVMSKSCAERCGLLRLVDPRFAGFAVGVGSARILGRVHMAPIKIGSQVYPCSFTVLEGMQNMELLLGLDMLKKHQCMIDLRNDCLHIGEDEELVPFLGESEVPEHARLSRPEP